MCDPAIFLETPAGSSHAHPKVAYTGRKGGGGTQLGGCLLWMYQHPTHRCSPLGDSARFLQTQDLFLHPNKCTKTGEWRKTVIDGVTGHVQCFSPWWTFFSSELSAEKMTLTFSETTAIINSVGQSFSLDFLPSPSMERHKTSHAFC